MKKLIPKRIQPKTLEKFDENSMMNTLENSYSNSSGPGSHLGTRTRRKLQTGCSPAGLLNVEEDKGRNLVISGSFLHPCISQNEIVGHDNENRLKISTNTLNSIRKIKANLHERQATLANQRNVRRILQKQKVQSLSKIFIEKMKRLRPNLGQKQLASQCKVESSSFLDMPGIESSSRIEAAVTTMSVCLFFLLLAILSLGVVFSTQPDDAYLQVLKIVSIVLVVLLALSKLFLVRNTEGRTIQTLRLIMAHYLKQSFAVDFVCIVVLLVDICSSLPEMQYVRALFLLKLQDFRSDIARIDYNLINSPTKEQYWRMARLLISNFFIAHLIALTLLTLAHTNNQDNWLLKVRLEQVSELEKYVWAYYWSVTTMLSVGYGDLTPSNSSEALCLIFIELASCISLAYTINCVGELMMNIRSSNQEKKKNLKILKELVDKNKVTKPVEEKIGSYIEKSIQLKNKFNYEEQKSFLKSLPMDVKADLLYECNLKLFVNVPVVKNFSLRAIRELSQKIELIISHPEEIILQKEQSKLAILKEGCVGLFALPHKYNPEYKMNEIRVQPNTPSRILSLEVLNRDEKNYIAKSISYSLIYAIEEDKLIEAIRPMEGDFQIFCFERDRAKLMLEQFEIIDCEKCPGRKHTRANCPKLHYTPYKSIVFFKNLARERNQKQRRLRFRREKPVIYTNEAKNKGIAQKFIADSNYSHCYKISTEIRAHIGLLSCNTSELSSLNEKQLQDIIRNQHQKLVTQDKIKQRLKENRKSGLSLLNAIKNLHLVSQSVEEQPDLGLIKECDEEGSEEEDELVSPEANKKVSYKDITLNYRKMMKPHRKDSGSDSNYIVSLVKNLGLYRNQKRKSVNNPRLSRFSQANKIDTESLVHQLSMGTQMLDEYSPKPKLKKKAYYQLLQQIESINTLECDVLHDFKNYFVKGNPKNLKNKSLKAPK